MSISKQYFDGMMYSSSYAIICVLRELFLEVSMSKDKKEKKKALHHTVSFPIRHVDGFDHPRDAFDKRFRIMQHIHNVLVKEANSRLVQLFSDKQYCALVQKYHRLKGKLTEKFCTSGTS